jgi:hypothetical protein
MVQHERTKRLPYIWCMVDKHLQKREGYGPCTTGVIQGADGCLLCRRFFIGAVGTEPHLVRTSKWSSAQASCWHRLTCADGHRRHKFGRRHRYSMAVGTAIAPTRLNTVPTAWPSAQSYANG